MLFLIQQLAGLSPVKVITGAVVSTTLTVLVADAVFPSKSVAEYVMCICSNSRRIHST